MYSSILLAFHQVSTEKRSTQTNYLFGFFYHLYYMCMTCFQKLHGDQRFWLTTTLLLCEASLSKIDKNSTMLNTPDPPAKDRVKFSCFSCSNFTEIRSSW